MNPDANNLITRPFHQVVDDILVSLVGGIVNEPIIFNVKSDEYPLAQPAERVRGITALLPDTSEPHEFTQDVDFVFDPDRNTIVWQAGSDAPPDEGVFFVDYFRLNVDSPLTDINVGSVSRTLSEAVGREIATMYQQINRAYRSGFIDTAEGTALDLVVAILDVFRKTKDFAVGLVTVFRDPEVAGDITMPSGTVLTTEKGDVAFETTEQRTLQRGQARIDLPVRAGEDFPGEAGKVDALAITQLIRPVAGVNRVVNFEATVLGTADETDEQLRERARAALRAESTGTLGAIEKAVRDGLGLTLETWDPNGPPARRSSPGTATLLIESEPERLPSLASAVNQVRSGGVLVGLIARYVFFTPKVVAEIAGGLTSAGKQKVVEEIIAAAQAYVDPLTSGDPVVGGDLLDAIRGVADVNDATVVDVLVSRSEVQPLAAETAVDAIAEFIEDKLPDTPPAELRTTLDDLLFDSGLNPPGADRIADRSLLRNADDSAQATDDDIEAGEFQVVTQIDADNWWAVLEMVPADIALVEGA